MQIKLPNTLYTYRTLNIVHLFSNVVIYYLRSQLTFSDNREIWKTQYLVFETFGGKKCRSLARKYADRRAGGQAVLRPVEHNLGLSLGRRGRGYRISPLATHSLSTRSTIFLRPPFDLARDSPEEKAQFSRNIFVSWTFGCVWKVSKRKKRLHETKAKRAERRWRRNTWWKRESVDRWLISLFSSVSSVRRS